jgi:hypothetical protein
MDKSLLSDQKWEQDLFNLGKRLGARFGGYGDLRQLALSFEVDETSSLKVSRNPQTGETIEIAAARVPKFRAGKALKDEIN